MLVRILTENKNYRETLQLVNKYFSGYTVVKTTGVWSGEDERGLIIEIDSIAMPSEDFFNEEIRSLCYDIKRLNKQDKILVQYINCNSTLI